VAREDIRKTLEETAREALREPTTKDNFVARWDILKVYLESLPRSVRRKFFSPGTLVNLRVAHYRSSESAAPRLDDLLAQAARLNLEAGG
jgi:hypothetical protein